MANTFILGGSPLGLIGVSSRPNRDGMSTFNGGKSRNINVGKYNTGSKQGDRNTRVSLFSGGAIPDFWPNIGITGTDKDETGTKNKDSYKGINRSSLHNNDVYDTSVLNIIEKLSSSNRAALRPQDFAYLKYLGVYPNNRLMIARRFTDPIKDNIMVKGGKPPLSVLISWKPENEDFLEFSFGEEWTEAEADFTNVLNKLGDNFGIGGMGTGMGKGLNVLPLPGFTETLQRKVLVKLGILDENTLSTGLPSGNPNIIKMAKRRKTIGYGEAGSGLKCKISINMKCEYEQKFISGVDPTIAWMDIINNILSFGTSNSSNYGLSGDFAKKLDKYTSDVTILISDIVSGLSEAFSGLVNDIKSAIESLSGDAEAVKKKKEEAENKANKEGLESLIKSISSGIEQTLIETVSKYKIEIMGIANALSGLPSTPWHITLGNPLRPIFCSGDMYISGDVKLTLGPTLAFNDLPSNIKVEFTLENARPLGLQEILAKFNTGYLRTVNVRRDFTVSGTDIYYEDNGNKVEEIKPSTSTGGINRESTVSNTINNKENSQQVTQNNGAL